VTAGSRCQRQGATGDFFAGFIGQRAALLPSARACEPTHAEADAAFEPIGKKEAEVELTIEPRDLGVEQRGERNRATELEIPLLGPEPILIGVGERRCGRRAAKQHSDERDSKQRARTMTKGLPGAHLNLRRVVRKRAEM
jgi:hypothetical protein